MENEAAQTEIPVRAAETAPWRPRAVSEPISPLVRLHTPSASPLLTATSLAVHPASLCLTQSVLTAYKLGNQIKRVTVNYGSDNDVLLREDFHQNEWSSTSESESDTIGRTLYTRLTPNNVEGVRPKVQQGGRDFVVERETRGKFHKAGARRKRRWMNDYFIEEQLTRFLPQDEEEARKEWLQLFLPQEKSCFQELMEDPRKMAKFRKFIDISPDDQMSKLPIAKEDPIVAVPSSTQEKFNSLGKATSRVLRQALRVPSKLIDPSPPSHRTDVFSHLDHVIRHFMTSHNHEKPPLRLFLPDAFHRHVCHGVAEFYNMCCYSKTEGDIRLTFVKPRKIGEEADDRTTAVYWLRSKPSLFDHLHTLNVREEKKPGGRRRKARSRASSTGLA